MTGTITAASRREIRFRAMGSDVHVIVVDGPAHLCADARSRIAELESRWSRFLPDSEISRLNRCPGRTLLVSPDTFTAVRAALDAWHATGGRFDPTVLPAVVAAGYDRTFTAMAPIAEAVTGQSPGPAPGCAEIILDPLVGAITLPPGTELDLGGIGKGLAADLVVQELRDAGASGACVNVGGDLRVHGAAPSDAGWVVGVEHLPDLRIALADGGVATTSSAKRRWRRAGTTMHHLIDPGTGRSADTGLESVTVIAATAVAAESLTKAAFVAGRDLAAGVIADAGATGVLVDDVGAMTLVPGSEVFLR